MTTMKATRRTELGILENRIQLAEEQLAQYKNIESDIKILKEEYIGHKEIEGLVLEDIGDVSELLKEKNNELIEANTIINSAEEKEKAINEEIMKGESLLEELNHKIERVKQCISESENKVVVNKEELKESKKIHKAELKGMEKEHEVELKKINDDIHISKTTLEEIINKISSSNEQQASLDSLLIQLIAKETEKNSEIKDLNSACEALISKKAQLLENNNKISGESSDLIRNNRKLELMISEAEAKLQELNSN